MKLSVGKEGAHEESKRTKRLGSTETKGDKKEKEAQRLDWGPGLGEALRGRLR